MSTYCSYLPCYGFPIEVERYHAGLDQSFTLLRSLNDHLVHGDSNEELKSVDDGMPAREPPFDPEGTESTTIVGLSNSEMERVSQLAFGSVCDNLLVLNHLDEMKPYNYTFW